MARRPEKVIPSSSQVLPDYNIKMITEESVHCHPSQSCITPGEISIQRSERKMEILRKKFRIRNFPRISEKNAKLYFIAFFNAVLGLYITPSDIVDCEIVHGWFYDGEDIVVTFPTRDLRDNIFKYLFSSLDRIQQLTGKSLEIYDELSVESVRIMKYAIEAFGTHRVFIHNSGIHILHFDGNIHRMCTLIQYRKFVRQHLRSFLKVINEGIAE